MKQDAEHIHFVTGRLAEHAVRSQTARLAKEVGFSCSIDVLPITVAALMTPRWLLRHIQVPKEATRVVIPGYLTESVGEINQQISIPVAAGPKDIRDLPLFFGNKRTRDDTYGEHSIEILAEINHAPRIDTATLIATAENLIQKGADLIDIGCVPGYQWRDVGTVVKELVERGIRVSIDSFDVWEVTQACNSGADVVLSVNSSNREAATDWNAEVVVIPDVPGDEKSFLETITFLSKKSTRMRLDPILEPIGCGFTESLRRYIDCRRSFPDAQMLMGIGNITELTDADSAGVNVLLLGICQELGIQSVLTTQVINWARSSVQECALARQLVHYACSNRIPPKHIEPDLVLLRDERVSDFDTASLEALAKGVRDKNIRIFAAENEIHAVSAGVHVRSEDPFMAMEQLLESPVADGINASHAFYLGFEMAKALTAITLGKQYTQDEALNWGFLTRDEDHHRLARSHRAKDKEQATNTDDDAD